MHRNRSVDVHQFAMVPRADVPRSSFRIQHTHKTTMDAGYLVPIYEDEMLPGDTFNLRGTFFARLATPIYPVMDNLVMDIFFFFAPLRLLWVNFKKFMGEQDNPGDSTSYVTPKMTSPVGGYAVGSIFDYFGLPTVGQVGAGATFQHNTFHLRAYNLAWNQWFRDENLQSSVVVENGDGPDNPTVYSLLRRGKRHDYFTGCLPFPQKGASVQMPLGTSAPVYSPAGVGTAISLRDQGTGYSLMDSAGANVTRSGTAGSSANGMFADLSQATAATINQLRQSFQIQRLLERDARGGTRYTEKVRAHFNVLSPDARQQRVEYIGGGTVRITINPIAQTSGSPAPSGYTSTPMGTLAAMGTALGKAGFTYSATEHGVVIGLAAIRADLTYQQGLRRMWSRSTQYDFYWPVFQSLGEQSVLNKEIYLDGSANDNAVFGYQEAWADYRYHPSRISGLFKSTSAGTIDAWHLAQRFTALPTLNSVFIQDTPPVERIVAVGAAANGQQFLFDAFYDCVAARPMPLYSVPGMIDHF